MCSNDLTFPLSFSVSSGAHWAYQCRKQTPPEDNYRCRHCRLLGHWDFNCPVWRRALVDRRAKKHAAAQAVNQSSNRERRPCLSPFGCGMLLPPPYSNEPGSCLGLSLIHI